jgi:hypothetical protein
MDLNREQWDEHQSAKATKQHLNADQDPSVTCKILFHVLSPLRGEDCGVEIDFA